MDMETEMEMDMDTPISCSAFGDTEGMGVLVARII